MTGRSKFWLAVGAVFFFVNFIGGVMAAVQGEFPHALVHTGLLVLGGYYVRRIWQRRESVSTDVSREITDSLTHLQQSVGAIAIEVERIGEGQRFITQLFTERAPGEGAAKSTEIKSRETPPRRH